MSIYLPNEVLSKLTKEGREQIIFLEGMYSECELELAQLDYIESQQEEFWNGGMSLYE